MYIEIEREADDIVIRVSGNLLKFACENHPLGNMKVTDIDLFLNGIIKRLPEIGFNTETGLGMLEQAFDKCFDDIAIDGEEGIQFTDEEV